ncbi:MAG: hypothetical protein RIQ53_4570 [Pseudomonadota bacterium]|jgi:hypothetical protein
MVRQFLSKGTDLSTVMPQKLACIDAMLNYRPRKSLDFRTPREAYMEIVEAELLKRAQRQTQCVADQRLTPSWSDNCLQGLFGLMPCSALQPQVPAAG